jgi:hypothetical protein
MTGEASVSAIGRALDLAADFWSPPSSIGRVRHVDSAVVPSPACDLLDHHSHMTVAMERHHGGPVRLRVEGVKDAGPQRYAREILLVGPAGNVVQYGIVRIDLTVVPPRTAVAIRDAREPLGRLLIAAGALREVHDVELLEIVPGPRLSGLFFSGATASTAEPVAFGRVALIDIDGRPAVELLEIVSPATR